MASGTTKQPCVNCNKGGGVATCGGCQQWFCAKHFNEHRQELSTQLDDIGQEHDLLQRDLVPENTTHSLLSYVNNWEKKSIAKIQIAAEEARRDLEEYLAHSRQRLKLYLDEVTKEIKAVRESDDYTEAELTKWMDQMNKIRKMLEKPSNIRIIDNNVTQSAIHLIEIVYTEMTDRIVKSAEQAPMVLRSGHSKYQLPNSLENTFYNSEEPAKTISSVAMRVGALVGE
ncbi:unnamed protein product [Rotaria socialis]|uniref:Uncharacterized protein n=1 Tax=Rotaria socialis TaxID=392032 RepID=A0A817Z491_9BILA|nr:unnamed protein product [Rotaria socialis]CAF3423226.1 unnamed protein product [Rotaria socialis]CAF4360703.1 unnamed protein product [Rotaria socialis]CAF4564411.1 unnamed protein product [Rotaria socialis]